MPSYSTNALATLAIAASICITSGVDAQKGVRISPGFDCASPKAAAQPLVKLICANDKLAEANFRYLMAVYALRHVVDEPGRHALVVEAEAFTKRMAEACVLSKTGQSGRYPTEQEKSCIEARLVAERARLAGQLPQEAKEELKLDYDAASFLQQALIADNFMPANSKVDGLFGPVTRAAIAKLQQATGQPTTGFASGELVSRAARYGKDERIAEMERPKPKQADIPSPIPNAGLGAFERYTCCGWVEICKYDGNASNSCARDTELCHSIMLNSKKVIVVDGVPAKYLSWNSEFIYLSKEVREGPSNYFESWNRVALSPVTFQRYSQSKTKTSRFWSEYTRNWEGTCRRE